LAANLSEADIQMVTFLLDHEEYAVNVMAVREIIDMTGITKTVIVRVMWKGSSISGGASSRSSRYANAWGFPSATTSIPASRLWIAPAS